MITLSNNSTIFFLVLKRFDILIQNASPLYPIVIDYSRDFQYRGQLSFVYLTNQSGIRSLQVTINLVHFEFFGAGLHGTLNRGVSVALTELN